MDITEFRKQYPDYDQVGDEQLAKALHAKYYGHVPYADFAGKFLGKKSTNLWEDVKLGLAGATNTMDTGITLAGRGLETLVGHDRSIEDNDALFKSLEERKKGRVQWANPENKDQSFAGQMAGMALTLPAQIPAMAGAAPERMTDLIDKGESVQTARNAGIADTLLNIGALAVPINPAFTRGRAAVAGTVSNTATGAASDLYTSLISKTDAAKETYNPLDIKRRAPEALLGAGFGYAGGKPKEKGPTPDPTPTRNKAEEIAARKKAPTEDPEQTEFFKQRAAAMQQAAIEAHRQSGETPLRMTQEGQAVPPALSAADDAAGIVGQEVIGRQFGGREARPGLEEQGSQPSALGLTAEQGDVGQPLGVGRTIMENGKLSTGMHPDVPTIDFPLRQEVLQQPEIKQAIEAFRQEHAANEAAIAKKNAEIDAQIKFMDEYAGSKEAMELNHKDMERLTGELDVLQQKQMALEAEFGRGMEQLGIRNPGEAHGLNRPLYEGENKGIPVKSTFDARKPINSRGLGGKQRGAIDPWFENEGWHSDFRRLSALTDQPWVREKFPKGTTLDNADGSPFVMLHGTGHEISQGKLRASDEGIHLGFPASAMMFTGGSRYSMGEAGFRGKTNPNRINRNGNLLPQLIKNGNYPYIGTDFGRWSPDNLVWGRLDDNTLFKDLVKAEAAKAGKEFSDRRYDWFADRIMQASDPTTRNKLFTQMLKENGIDGFFYKNTAESAKTHYMWEAKESQSPLRRERAQRLADNLVHSTSFVTWDAGNVMPLHDRTTTPKNWHKQSGKVSGELLAALATGGISMLLARKGPWNTMQAFRGAFNEGAIRSAIEESVDPNSRRYLVLMDPKQFLEIAENTHLDFNSAHSQEKITNIRAGLETEEGLGRAKNFYDLPTLQIGSDRTVVGHEGRHRMQVLSEEVGLDKVPVLIDRWSARNKSGNFDPPKWSERGEPILSFPEPLFRTDENGKVTNDPNYKVDIDRKIEATLRNPQAGAVTPEFLLGIATGGIYPASKWIAKKVGDSPSKLTSPVTDDFHRNEAYSRATGSEDYIAKGPSVEEARELIKAEPDINSANNLLVGGAEMFAAIKNSTAVASVKLWARAARKLAELKDREEIKPIEKQFRQLFRNGEAVKLAETFKVESRDGIKFTDAELAEIGHTPDQIAAYKGLRDLFDQAYELQKSKMSPEDAKRFTKLDAYLASQWRGDWGAPIYDASGKLVWWIRETSKGRAQNAIKRVLESDPTLKADKVQYKKNFMAGNEATLIQSYSKLVEILGKDDPAVQRISEVIKDYYTTEGEQTQGQKKHFKPKAGVRGFEGDRLDRSPKQNAEDLFNAQFAYLRSAFEWGHMQDAMNKVATILKDPELQQTHENTLKWMREDIRNIMGFGTEPAIRNMENWVSKVLGHTFAPIDTTINKFYPKIAGNYTGLPTDVGSMRTAIGAAKMGFYNMTLGVFNVPFMVTNVLQPGFAIPHMIELMNNGYKANPVRSFAEGAAMFGSAGMYHYHMTKGDRVAAQKVLDSVPDQTKQAILYLEANGIVELNQFSEVGKLTQSELGQTVNNWVGWSIQKPEFMARTSTFMAFVSHLTQSGMKDVAEIHRIAEDRTNMVMGNYKHFERAGVFNKTGLTGNMAGTLQTFPINQYNQLYNFGKKATFKDPKTLAPLVMMMGYQFALAGAMGFYGVDTADKLWNWIKENGAEYGWISPAAASFNLKKAMLDNLPTWSSYGALSNLSGINWSSRMDAGTIPGFGDNQLMPFLSFYSGSIEKAAKMLADYNEGTRDAFIMQAAPSSTKGLLEAQLPTFGEDFARPTKDPNSYPFMKRNEDDKSARKWNLQTTNEASARTREYASKATDMTRSAGLKATAEKFENAVRYATPDKLDDLMLKYIQFGGDPRSLMRSLDNRLQQRYITKMQSLGMKAKSPGAIYKYMERGGQADVPGTELSTR